MDALEAVQAVMKLFSEHLLTARFAVHTGELALSRIIKGLMAYTLTYATVGWEIFAVKKFSLITFNDKS